MLTQTQANYFVAGFDLDTLARWYCELAQGCWPRDLPFFPSPFEAPCVPFEDALADPTFVAIFEAIRVVAPKEYLSARLAEQIEQRDLAEAIRELDRKFDEAVGAILSFAGALRRQPA